jgi:hypothetical protein
MAIKNENPIDSFVENSKKNRERNRKISDDDLKRINDLLEEANKEEAEQDKELPIAAKSNEIEIESQV